MSLDNDDGEEVEEHEVEGQLRYAEGEPPNPRWHRSGEDGPGQKAGQESTHQAEYDPRNVGAQHRSHRVERPVEKSMLCGERKRRGKRESLGYVNGE